MLAPLQYPEDVPTYAAAGLASFAMELVPRITRAQAMDVLSSQANLAGYRIVLEAAVAFGRALPMMMTAAGTIAPARVLVMGAGVAGLQAIATARRLGAIVSATDVRLAAKEQVESLGATFLAVDLEAMKAMETAGGYAKEMGEDFAAPPARAYRRGAEEDRHRRSAPRWCPGRRAPVLLTARDGRGDAARARSSPTSRSSRAAMSRAASPARSVVDAGRRHHSRPVQRAVAHRGRCEPALRPQPVGVPRPHHRQGQAPQHRSSPTRS